MSVLFTEKLTGKHIGVFFGTFAPAHLGHYQNIIQAKRETDGCLVIVSGYQKSVVKPLASAMGI